jgi:hypothetical protein
MAIVYYMQSIKNKTKIESLQDPYRTAAKRIIDEPIKPQIKTIQKRKWDMKFPELSDKQQIVISVLGISLALFFMGWIYDFDIKSGLAVGIRLALAAGIIGLIANIIRLT